MEKGNEDGLMISSISSCVDLWAVIMDAGTGFTDQVHQMSPHFLHKVYKHPICCSSCSSLCSLLAPHFHREKQDWIMEQWEKNFYISSVAGSNNGSSLVVMSKGIVSLFVS